MTDGWMEEINEEAKRCEETLEITEVCSQVFTYLFFFFSDFQLMMAQVKPWSGVMMQNVQQSCLA